MNARIPDAYEEFIDGMGSGQAFNFTAQTVDPQWNPGPSTTGSTLGVPPATSIAGITPGGGASLSAYASTVNSRGAGSHPVLWAIAIFFAGIVMLGMLSHIEVKRR